MMNLDKLQHVVIVGCGVTGASALRYLAPRVARITVVDTRPTPPQAAKLQQQFPNVTFLFGGLQGEILLTADTVILSPGIASTNPLFEACRSKKIPILSDIELFARQAQAPIIGITGTNGKSTVTTLVAELINASGKTALAGGNLGPAALDLLAQPKPDYYVLELSSFQLDITEYLPLVSACILNVTPDHLDRYNDYPAYIASKQRIYRQAKVAVYFEDDAATRPPESQQMISFGVSPHADFGVQDNNLAHADERLLACNELHIKGKQNWANALASLALIEPLALPNRAAVIRALADFRGLAHRCEWVAEIQGVAYYNDSKATNVGATQAALLGLAAHPANIILLAGGQGKSADFSELAALSQQYVKRALLYGQDAPQIAKALQGTTHFDMVADLTEAVSKAHALAAPGDVVLLSPACASFDMFTNFEHRGDTFKQLVTNLLP